MKSFEFSETPRTGSEVLNRIEVECPQSGKSLVVEGKCLAEFYSDPDKNQISKILFELMSQPAELKPAWEEYFLDLQIGQSKRFAVRFMGLILHAIDPTGLQDVCSDDYKSIILAGYEKILGAGGSGGGIVQPIHPPNLPGSYTCRAPNEYSGDALDMPLVAQIADLKEKVNAKPSLCSDKNNENNPEAVEQSFLASRVMTSIIINLARGVIANTDLGNSSYLRSNFASSNLDLQVVIVSCYSDLWDGRILNPTRTENVLPPVINIGKEQKKLTLICKNSIAKLDGLYAKISCEITSNQKLYGELTLSDSIDGFSSAVRRATFTDVSGILNSIAPVQTRLGLGRADIVLSLNLLEGQQASKLKNQHLDAGFFDG